jgi:hypothetical protein
MRNLLPFVLLFSASALYAQQNNFCGQVEMNEKYLKLHPEVKQQRDALEIFTANYTANYYLQLQQNSRASDTIQYIIPVVFHIMHDYGDENISKAQILDVIRIMNEDFQKRNPDTSQVIPLFQPIIGNVQVEFRLAQLDPDGNCTDGITRHQTYLTNGGDDALKAIVNWPADRYLNIWVEKFISNPSVAAYSNLPGVAANLDGIVAAHSFVGSIGTSYNSPSVYHMLSHEAGHYLNLWHTWGQTNTPGIATNCEMDDFVFDTPNTIGSSGCNLSQSTCTEGEIDNVQNIMDYSSCRHMFTQGQAARMQAALNSNLGNRNNLWTPANLLLTGTNNGYLAPVCAPVADFSNKTIRICEGQSVTFNNASYGGDFTTINWTFAGGNILNSTDTNPTVFYDTVGLYDVTLNLTNNSGSSTLVRPALVEVSPAIAATPSPMVQDFETLTFPSNYWYFENYVGTHWQTTTLASVSGSSSIYLQNDSTSIGTSDVLYTQSYNLSNITAPVFNFKLAFANRNDSNDNLKIFMSTDCGNTWVLKYTKAGSSLKTSSSAAFNFIPTSSEWRQDAMNISTAAGQPNVRFKFEFTSLGGNNIFIDDINIGSVTGIEKLNVDAINLSLSPNPAQNQTVLSFELFAPATVSYSISDITGRILLQSTNEKKDAGNHFYTIYNPQAAGVYFITLNINGQRIVKKLVFE